MSYTYATLISALETTAVIQDSDSNWQNIKATILDQAEQRCYRDLQLLSTAVRDTSGTFASNNRNFTLPQSLGYFTTVKGINAVVNGVRSQLRPVSLHFLDATWPSDSPLASPSVPKYFAPLTDQTFVVGPPPDQTYAAEVWGTIRPSPLSVSNPTTFLTNYLSDLFFAACMSAITGYQRDYGAQSDDPRLAVSWETQYQQRFASASREELMRKFQSGDWTSEPRPVPASPQG